MKTKQKIGCFLTLSVILTASMISPSDAQAWSWKHEKESPRYSRKQHRYHRPQSHHPRIKSYPSYSYGTFQLSLPIGNVSISIGGRRYHYYHGSFYRSGPIGYMVVSAPIGAGVPYLPYGYQKIYVDGIPYYSYNGVYYIETSRGYVVVEKPDLNFSKKETAARSIAVQGDHDVTVNIPNNRGGYTSVTLKQVGDGYIGPQGEYYEDFPKIEKLKIIYGT